MLKGKRRYIYYRKYGVDIWGDSKNNLNKFLLFFLNKFENLSAIMKNKLESIYPRISAIKKRIIRFFFLNFRSLSFYLGSLPNGEAKT